MPAQSSILWNEIDLSCDDKVIDADFMGKIVNTLKILVRNLEVEVCHYGIICWREREEFLERLHRLK
jgi:hypothetical protein